MGEEDGQSQHERAEIMVRREAAARRPNDLDKGAGGGRGLALPASGELELMLASADDGESLADLERAATTLMEVAKRQDVLQEKLREIAEWGLRVKRKLGGLLAQTDARGGDRSKWHDAILLPGNLNPSAAKRLRQLARVEEEDFRRYLERGRARQGIPSMAGCLRFAQRGVPGKVALRKRKGRSVAGRAGLAPQVLDALRRCLGDIDVVVGSADLGGVRCMPVTKKDVFDHLRGNVVIAACLDPSAWLLKLEQMREAARFKQVLAVLPAEVWSDWFAVLQGGAWSCCFVRGVRDAQGVGQLIAHLGEKPAAFEVVAQEVGVLWSHRS